MWKYAMPETEKTSSMRPPRSLRPRRNLTRHPEVEVNQCVLPRSPPSCPRGREGGRTEGPRRPDDRKNRLGGKRGTGYAAMRNGARVEVTFLRYHMYQRW